MDLNPRSAFFSAMLVVTLFGPVLTAGAEKARAQQQGAAQVTRRGAGGGAEALQALTRPGFASAGQVRAASPPPTEASQGREEENY